MGRVAFAAGTTPLGDAPLDGEGRATLTTDTLAYGDHAITATYGGDSDRTASTGTLIGGQLSDHVAPVTTDDVPADFRAAPVVVTLTTADAGGSGVAATHVRPVSRRPRRRRPRDRAGAGAGDPQRDRPRPRGRPIDDTIAFTTPRSRPLRDVDLLHEVLTVRRVIAPRGSRCGRRGQVVRCRTAILPARRRLEIRVGVRPRCTGPALARTRVIAGGFSAVHATTRWSIGSAAR